MKTVKLLYAGQEPVAVPDARLTVKPGEAVDVPEEIAASLLQRSEWQSAKTPVKED